MSFWNIFPVYYVLIGLVTSIMFLYVKWPSRSSSDITLSYAMFAILFWPIVLPSMWHFWITKEQHNYASQICISPTGKGYWIVLRSKSFVPFGDAWQFEPSAARSIRLNLTSEPKNATHQYDKSGKIYVASNGLHHGDLLDRVEGYSGRVSDVLVLDDRSGYWILDAGGQIFSFGSAPHFGDLLNAGKSLNLNAKWRRRQYTIRPARLMPERVVAKGEMQEPVVASYIAADDSQASL